MEAAPPPPPSTSRFRFRDHNNDMENGESIAGDTGSESSSISSDEDPETESDELTSMTAKGINHLCLELIELKQASEMDFQENVISNYLSFIRIFKETGGVNNEVMQLKHHLTAQKQLVGDLRDGVYPKILSDDTTDTFLEKTELDDQDPINLFKSHADYVLLTLDTLLVEQRLDEAFMVFKMEDGASQTVKFQEDIPQDIWMSYRSAIAERRVMLADKLMLVADNPRVSAAELQKSLVGLSRLGFDHLATRFLLKYYHSRIYRGANDLQSSKAFLHGVYVCDLARFVFSMISQAAKSFVTLHGETSPYDSELIKWASEETEIFAGCFSKFIRSVSEISGGLSTVVDSVHFAMSYCSLLESQKLVLRPCLIEHILPCMEDVLKNHFAHFKKVISIFTSSDVWVVGRYLVSGMLTEGSCSMILEQHPEYCLLTNSGRKFVTLLQAVTNDISSLVSFSGSAILKGLMDLFTEYSFLLEKALTKELDVAVKGPMKINMAESLSQQVSVIANLSTLEHFFSSVIRSLFNNMNNLKFEIDTLIISVQDNCCRLRTRFCKQFIHVIMSKEAGRVSDQIDSKLSQDMMPSLAYQDLFLELREVEELAEDNVIEIDWLMRLLTELMETTFEWISSNGETWITSEDDTTDQQSAKLTQFTLDMHFLVEVARHGGYLTTNMINASTALVSRIRSALVSAAFEEERCGIDYGKAAKSAMEALQHHELEETKWNSEDDIDQLDEDYEEYQTRSANDSMEDNESRSSLDIFYETAEIIEESSPSALTSSMITEFPATEKKHRQGAGSIEDELHNNNSASTAYTGSSIGELEAENEVSVESELKEIKRSKLQKLSMTRNQAKDLIANLQGETRRWQGPTKLELGEGNLTTSDELLQLRKIKRVSSAFGKE